MKPWFHLLLLASRSFALFASGGFAAHCVAAADSTPTNHSAMSSVSGTLHFGPQKAKMTHVYFRRKDTDDGPVTALMFSDHALPAKALEDRQKLLQLARKRAFFGLYAELADDGTLRQSELLYDDGAFSGPWRFEPPKGKAIATAGRIATEGEDDFFGKPYAVNLTFNLAGHANGSWSGSPLHQTKPTGLPIGQASGWMERVGRKTEFKHAVALIETTLFGESGERSLLFTTRPVTDEMLASSRGPETELHHAGIAYLRARLNEQGEVESLMTPSDDGNAMTFSSNQWSAELAAMPASELDGLIECLEERDPISEYPRFQIRFHAAVRRVGSATPVTADNGKPLPKDGGEPAKAYHAFAQALKKARTIEELVPLRIASVAREMESVPVEQRAAMFEFIKSESSVPLKIVGGFANETQATLWLEGKQGDERITGRVNVHREDGAWKLGSEEFRIRAGDAK